MNPFKKVKQIAARSAGASWHKHINKWEKRVANRVIRRIMRNEKNEYEDLK